MKKPVFIGLLICVALISVLGITFAVSGGFNLARHNTRDNADTLKIKVKDLNEKVSMQDSLIKNLKTSLNSAITENTTIAQEIDRLQAKIEAERSEVDKLKSQIEFFSRENKRLEGSLRNQADSFEKEKKDYTLQHQQLEKNIELNNQQALASLGEYDKQITQLKDEIIDLSNQNNALLGKMRMYANSALVQETAKMHYNLAALYVKNEDYQSALNEYKRAVEFSPHDADIHYNLAVLADIHLVDYPLAIKYYKYFLQYQTNDPKEDEVEERLLALQLKESSRIGPPLSKNPNDLNRQTY